MVRTRPTLAATLLATLLLAPSLASAGSAAPPSRVRPHARPAAASAAPLARLGQSLRGLWGKEGMTIDPNGARAAGSGTAGQASSLTGAGAAMLIAPRG